MTSTTAWREFLGITDDRGLMVRRKAWNSGRNWQVSCGQQTPPCVGAGEETVTSLIFVESAKRLRAQGWRRRWGYGWVCPYCWASGT
jgi:hypothetical protein